MEIVNQISKKYGSSSKGPTICLYSSWTQPISCLRPFHELREAEHNSYEPSLPESQTPEHPLKIGCSNKEGIAPKLVSVGLSTSYVVKLIQSEKCMCQQLMQSVCMSVVAYV